MDYFEKISSQHCNVSSDGKTSTFTSKNGETSSNCHINVTRDPKESIDIITTNSDEKIPFCHIGNLSPLIQPRFNEEGSFLEYNIQALQYYVASKMAVHHLNTGDGSLIQEIGGLNETCPIRFTMEPVNTAGSASVSIPALFQILRRDEPQKPSPDLSLRFPLPCAFLGASASRVSVPTSIMSGYLGYPQISFKSTSPYLNNKEKHKFFGRTIPSDDGTSVRIVDYFRKINVTHLGVLFVEDDYGIAFSQALQKIEEKDKTMKITTVGIPSTSSNAEIKIAMKALKKTKYRYFFSITIGEGTFHRVMEAALEQEILGPGYTWMFGDGVIPNFFTFNKTSKLVNATKGSSIIQADAKMTKIFKISWREFVENNIEYIDEMLQKYGINISFTNDTVTGILLGPEAGNLTSASLYAYDAMIALGISACNRINKKNFELNGKDHFEEFKKINFQGVSGNVIFDDETGTRQPDSAMFMVTNMFGGEAIGEIGKIRLKAAESEKYVYGNWQTMKDYIYNDGGIIPHPDLPDLQTDYMYIGNTLRICALFLSTLIICMSIGFMSWTFLNRNQKVVQVSQPFFLYIICIGTLLMAFSVIPKSMDDEIRSTEVLDIGCMVSPWFGVVGFSISFSALFAKTWRINQLFHNPDMRRKQVLIKDVLWSMLIIPLLSIILLSLWTIISPLRWRRVDLTKDAYGRVNESRGFCTSSNSWPFVGCLLFVLFCAIIIALKQLYLSRHITMEFGESRYITAAICGMALVIAFATPILFIANDNPKADLFVFAFFIFVTCTLILLFMFVPKIRFHRAIISGSLTMKDVVQEFARQSMKSQQREQMRSMQQSESSISRRSRSKGMSNLASSIQSIQLSQEKYEGRSGIEKLDIVSENEVFTNGDKKIEEEKS